MTPTPTTLANTISSEPVTDQAPQHNATPGACSLEGASNTVKDWTGDYVGKAMKEVDMLHSDLRAVPEVVTALPFAVATVPTMMAYDTAIKPLVNFPSAVAEEYRKERADGPNQLPPVIALACSHI